MRLTTYLNADGILLQVRPGDKQELLEMMLDALLGGATFRDCPAGMGERIRQAVRDREAREATTMGNGLLFPHARVAGLTRLGLCLAVLAEPQDYGAPDGRPVDVALLAVCPEQEPAGALLAMARIAELLSEETASRRLRSATDPAALYEWLERCDLRIDSPVLARHVMRPPALTVRPETPLRDVTARMARTRQEAIAVVDSDGILLGEISCDGLFHRGMPDFFRDLTTIAFIREFDPFEKYFQEEATAVAGDFLTREIPAVPEDATLLEVVYELAIRRHPKVYVTREGRLLGTVGRATVLEKILSL